MTQLIKNPDSISNHFDKLFSNIGHRGSSFTDVDGLVHDAKTNRFLLMEFKMPGERLSAGQEWAISEFAKQPGCWAWAIWLTKDPALYKIRYYPEKNDDTLSDTTLQRLLADWWENKANPGNINYAYAHLRALVKAFIIATDGDRLQGVAPDPPQAVRLKTAIKCFVLSDYNLPTPPNNIPNFQSKS
jgi:hypothetical protein